MSGITDVGLRRLAGAPRLKMLTLFCSPKVTDAGLEGIERLKHLEIFSLGKPKITDRGLVHFKEMPALKELGLGGSQGQRVLTLCSSKDLEHVFVVPTTIAAFHGHAVFVGVLLQQGQREAI